MEKKCKLTVVNIRETKVVMIALLYYNLLLMK